jgi:dienelactone hydrolase
MVAVGNGKWRERGSVRARRAASALVALCAAALLAPASAGAQTALGIPCAAPQDGVFFCQGDSAHRVEATSTDKHVLLDVNVALPAGGANLPLVIQMHGWGGQKGGLDRMKPWAQRGYAVLNYTSRGFNGSCGSPAARGILPPDPTSLAGCQSGWIKLMDTRYEIRDAQELAGRLADEGVVDGQLVAPTGGSYGGGFSMALAALRDRVMNLDGTVGPSGSWHSPGGKPMRIAAAAPQIPWTDLVYSLMPNGRTLDYTVTGPNDDRSPIGVSKQSFVSGLFALGQASGYYAPPGMDDQADLARWFALINAGDPYDSNPQAQAIVQEIADHHSSYYIPDSEAPAPLLLSNGFTDDLFPVDEAVRFYNRLLDRYPSAAIKLMFFDYGHQRGANKPPDVALLRDATFAWFDHYLRGVGPAPADDVTALTQTCPKTAASGGPFTAPTWAALHPGEVRLLSAGAQTIASGGGDPSVNSAVDPVAGGGDACATTSSANLNGTATYRFPAAAGDGFTLMGSPTVVGKFAASGTPGTFQIAARLWDVAPGDGPQTLVARGLYRPKGDGSTEVFQLHPNAWRFAPGHQAKLELLGNDAPYGRASNGAFTITATGLDVRLAVHDAPGSANGQVQSPAAPFVPAGAHLAPGVVSASLRVRYRSRSARSARRRGVCRWRSVRASVSGRGLSYVRRTDFLVGSRRLARDVRAPFAATITSTRARRAHSRRLRAVLTTRDGRRVTLKRTLRAC